MSCYIVEFEQNGEDRAAYGEQLLKKLEQRLKTKGLNERRFREFRRLRLIYPQTETWIIPADRLFNRLSSTHLNTISGIENPVKRPCVPSHIKMSCYCGKYTSSATNMLHC